jgi:hypothetical protein
MCCQTCSWTRLSNRFGTNSSTSGRGKTPKITDTTLQIKCTKPVNLVVDVLSDVFVEVVSDVFVYALLVEYDETSLHIRSLIDLVYLIQSIT